MTYETAQKIADMVYKIESYKIQKESLSEFYNRKYNGITISAVKNGEEHILGSFYGKEICQNIIEELINFLDSESKKFIKNIEDLNFGEID